MSIYDKVNICMSFVARVRVKVRVVRVKVRVRVRVVRVKVSKGLIIGKIHSSSLPEPRQLCPKAIQDYQLP